MGEGTGEGDVVDVVAGGLRVRAILAPARHPAVDESRVPLGAHVGTDAEALHHPGAEPLDERIGLADEVEEGGDSIGMLQIEGDVATSALEHVEPGVGRDPADGGGTVDADDVGPHIGKHHCRERSRADPRDLDDPHSLEWSRHVCPPVLSCQGLRSPWAMTASTICGQSGTGRSWPMSSSMSSSAPGVISAVRCPPDGVMRVSSQPWITSIGTRSWLSPPARSPLARIAAICRDAPSG